MLISSLFMPIGLLGLAWVARHHSRRLDQDAASGEEVGLLDLSEREREVLELLARGWSNHRIGENPSSHPSRCATMSHTS